MSKLAVVEEIAPPSYDVPVTALRASPESAWRSLQLALVLVVAWALRAWGLQGQSFSMDEVTELLNVRRPLGEVLGIADGFPPLYDILLRAWLSMFGTDHAARWLSVLLGCLSIVAIWKLAEYVGGARVAFWTAVLLALSPFHVWYSQEARAYGLYLLLAIVALWLFFRASELNRRIDWTLYAAVSVAGLYTHYYFSLLLLTNAAIFFVEQRHRVSFKRALAAHAAIALCSLPLLISLRGDLLAQSESPAPAPFSLVTVGYTYFSFVAGYSIGPSMRELHVAHPLLAILEFLPWVLAVGFAVVVLGYQGILELRNRKWRLRLLIIAFLPQLLTGLLAEGLDIGYRVRYAMWAAIPLFLLLGAGLARLATQDVVRGVARWCAAASALILLLVSGVSLVQRNTAERYANEDLRGLADYLKSTSSPTAPVFVASGYMAPAVGYHLGSGWKVLEFPRVADSTVRLSMALRLIETTVPHGQRYWLVYTRAFHGDPKGYLLDALLRSGSIRPQAEFTGAVLYEGTAP
jgi:hypothetical protein